MSTLKRFLPGSPRLERNGEPLKVVTRKSMALLAYLATIGETHNREALVTLLWPELEPSRARAGLRRNLSTLKKTLAGEWLVADRETIGLDRDTDAWVDMKQFHQLLETWRTHDHPATNICTDCLSTWSRAASDWHRRLCAAGTVYRLFGLTERYLCVGGNSTPSADASRSAKRNTLLLPRSTTSLTQFDDLGGLRSCNFESSCIQG